MTKDRDGRHVNRRAPAGRFTVESDSPGSGQSGSVFTYYRLPKDTTVVRLRGDVHERGLNAARESLRLRRDGSR